MNLAKCIFPLLFIIPIFSSAQRGKDGNYTATALNTTVNSYTYLTANATSGASTITVNSNSMLSGAFSSALAQGDLLLIIQMQGVTMDIDVTPATPTASGGWGGNYTKPGMWLYDANWMQDITKMAAWGAVKNYNNAGKFEQVEVRNVSGSNTIILNCALQNNYTSSGRVQVVRVPRFNNLTINSSASITPPSWDGTTGGIVAIEVKGNLTLNASSKISASGAGFRGGSTTSPTPQSGSPGTCSAHANGTGNGSTQLGSSSIGEGGRKGESIGGYDTEYTALYSAYGRGSAANGGGGGGFQNCGGGGGSNIGSGTYTGKGVPSTTVANSVWNLESAGFAGSSSSGGGRGGYANSNSNQNATLIGPNSTAWCATTSSSDARKENGGFGGHPLTYDATRLFMGGGGGAGDQDQNQGGSGGTGGGVVFLTVYGTISGTGSIEADGGVGSNSNPNTQTPGIGQLKGNDGAGGGGGGGSVFVKNLSPIPAGLAINAKGGNGGNHAISVGSFANTEGEGPGGAGAGGNITMVSGSPTQNVNGGIAGTSNSSHLSEFTFNGATNGAAGVTGLTTTVYDIVPNNVSVCGGSSATLTVTVSGTSPGTLNWYTAQFGGSSFATGNSYTTPVLTATTTYYVGICPGTFRVPVTVTVNPQPTIAGTVNVVNPSCSAPGSITGLTVSGGTIPYQYAWNGVASATIDHTNLIAGTYSLTVTDAGGCTASSGPYTLTGTSGPIIDASAVNVQNVNCSGGLGSISGITATGTGLSFGWTNSGGSALNALGLSPGNYTLTVTDNNSCTATVGPFNVGTDTGPTIDETNVFATDATCGNNNGSITGIVASGSSLTFSWNGISSTSADASGLSQGTYTLTVTDAGGCTVSSSPITVNAIAGPSIDVTAIVITDENCNQANGAISGISINGGTPNYSYAWSGTSQTTLDLVGLSQGSYTLTVSDQNGCTASSSAFAILNIAGPSINETAVSVNNVLCDGTLGSIFGLSDAGNGNTYSWTNGGGSTLNASNLLPGSYVLTITDNSGCTVLSNPYVVAPPAGLTIDTSGISISQTACSTNTGSVSGIIIVGGSNPVPSWSNGLGTLDISNLAAGTYTLIVIDDESCSDTVGVTISTVNGPTINMSAIAIESEHCGQSDGSISGISVTGGTPTYSYQWNGSSSIGTDILNAAAGSYTLTVTDAQGCTASATASINALSVPIINSNTIVVVQPTCISGGSINGITVVAGGIYTYSWTNTAQSTLDLNNLSAGTYVLTVTDAFGCSSTSGPVTILAPENPVAAFDYLPQDPGINQEVSFDNASQNIVSSVWTLDSTTISSENISYTFENEGTYEVLLVVTDANGCIDSVMQVITITGDLQIPNVITDNSDGVNDIFEIQGLKENTSLVILNRWGQKVFETSNYANDWKGLDLTGEKLTEGVYSYFLQTAEGQKEHGFVHLIR